MSTNYDDIAKQNWSDIQPPTLLPLGSWELVCRAAKLVPPKSEEQKWQVLFMFQAVEPMEDVSDDALAQLGEGWEDRVENIAYRTFFSTASDKQKVKKLLVRLGVTNVDELNVETALKAAVNGRAIGYVQQEHFTTKGGEAGVKNAVSHFIDQAA
jgi:hypothetical protein